MTPAEFNTRMQQVCSSQDLSQVKREGQKLIIKALGENAESFLTGLDVYMKRLEGQPVRSPKPRVEPIE